MRALRNLFNTISFSTIYFTRIIYSNQHTYCKNNHIYYNNYKHNNLSANSSEDYNSFAQAVVSMQCVTKLSNDKIIIYIEEFSQLIQAKVNGTFKITVKKIQQVSP
ncbi:hypothetical protein QTP86_023348 [Hemibagrus guttatus]|nr:hypothetical protein QTP86_023348 [Hemibagrus guttatus]